MSNAVGDLFEENYISFKKYLRSRYAELNDYDVEDIISQTLIKLLYKGDDLLSINNLSSYMYTSLSNGAKDYFKKENRVEIHEDNSPHFEGESRSPEDEYLLKELKELIKTTLFSLDPKLRFVFIETEFKGRTYKDLVEITGDKLGTLLSRKNRAKQKLRIALEAYLYL